MDWNRNPFKVLGATPMDSRHRLASLASDAELLGNAEAAHAAYTALLNPETRLQAEISWIPASGEDGQPELVSFNRQLKGLLDQQITGGMGVRVIEVCETYEKTNASAILQWINQARKNAGFHEAQPSEVIGALGEHARKAAQAVYEHMSKMSRAYVWMDIICSLGSHCEKNKAKGFAFCRLAQELADTYELSVAAKEKEQREAILRLSQSLQAEEKKLIGGDEVYAFEQHLKEWGNLAKPLYQIREAAGRQYPSYVHCVREAHNATVDVVNKCVALEKSFWLTTTLKRLFGDMRDYSESIDKLYNFASAKYHAKEEQQEKTRQAGISNLLSLIAILIVMGLLTAFSNSHEEKKKPTTLPSNSTIEFIRQQQETVAAHQEAMRGILKVQLIDQEAKLETLKQQMEEVMADHEQNPSVIKMELYRKLQQTYAETEEKCEQLRKQIAHYTPANQLTSEDILNMAIYGTK